jgi:hypothetical protein
MATDVNLGMLSLEELRRLLGSGQASPSSQMAGVSPYQQIMGRMPLLQNPYAGVSGGYNNFQGGYNPNMYSNAPRAIGQLGFGGGGGSGGSEPAAPSAWSSMTPAEQAAYYAANPTMATITQLGQKAFGYTGLGALQRAMQPGFVNEQSLIAMGVNPAAYQAAKEGFRASEIADMNAAAEAAANAAMNAESMQSMQDAYNADMAAASGGFGGYGGTSSDSGVGNPGESDSGGYGGTSSDTGAGNPGESGSSDSSSGGGDGTSSGAGTDSGGDGWAKGGKVTKDRLKGPDPKGPDEGYGALLSGEYVIKKSAVNKYGTGLLDMINAGKIPAKKMKSLLG